MRLADATAQRQLSEAQAWYWRLQCLETDQAALGDKIAELEASQIRSGKPWAQRPYKEEVWALRQQRYVAIILARHYTRLVQQKERYLETMLGYSSSETWALIRDERPGVHQSP